VQSPHIDCLSRLPNELLCEIFEDVLTDRDQGQQDWRRPQKVFTPLSKRFLDIQRQFLYRYVKFSGWHQTQSFQLLVRTVVQRPSIGAFILSLHFTWASFAYPNQPCSTSEEVGAFFRAVVNLQNLTLGGSLTPRIDHDSHKLVIYADRVDTILLLTSILENSNIASACELREDVPCHFITPPTQIIPVVEISDLSILPCPPNHLKYYRQRSGPRKAGLIMFNFTDFQLSSLTSASGSSHKTSTSTSVKVNPIFSRLESASLEDTTSESAQSLLVTLKHFPLHQLTLSITNKVPIAPLLALVSAPTAHSTLRKLDLEFGGTEGNIGTRVVDQNFDGIFSRLDLATEDIVRAALPSDWIYPQHLPDLPVDDLLLLRARAEGIEVEVKGTRLFRAIEVQQALDEDTAILEERWEQWQKDSKKSRKSRKQRR